ncbi:hypothetical protein B5K08_22430 [Rhizobium leguminosarum bv. trifolii]|uniref:Uncharacterized protein n=1 Tax=Rhizobium leguminosarum bv. trifolii TaxID=386 RepID=A0A3E1B7Z0_RHILT|nr:hypothetical protein [Rhizobium leguminosarum]RFB87207.1 hypothetical protein B5K08_22430 [Rhizobium leguminosarum bv. trifolii]RFB87388.1 hypothetical protein B5K10_22420 [Rhizobium leguminosarum bv. trifolii]
MSSNASPTFATQETKGFIMLRGAMVMISFRESLFDASNRAGVTPNEFCLQAAAEKLKASGHHFSGLFTPGDTNPTREA